METLTGRLRDGSLLFWLLPAVYFLLFGFHGFADTDQGYIPALAWRIRLGQVPYLDFTYVRPPLTPLLHSLELWIYPRDFQVLGMRLDFYAMMAGSVAFGVMALRRFFDFNGMGIKPWILGCAGFIYGVHNFPAMPWHTVDGIFFGSLGFWLLSRPGHAWQMAAGLCMLGLAGLAKQPFALLLPAGLALLFVLQPAGKATAATVLAGLAMAATSLLLLALLPPGFAAAMAGQVMGAGALGDLLGAGVIDYLRPLGLFVLPMAAVFAWFRFRGEAMPAWIAWGMAGALALFPLVHAAIGFREQAFMPPRLGIFHALLMAGFCHALAKWRSGEGRAAAVLAALCALSWAGSLSWGYAIPALFALPGIFGLLGLLRSAVGARLAPSMQLWIAGLGFVGFSLLQLFPYRDAPRWQMEEGAGDLFPALGGIRVGHGTLARLKELQGWDRRYGGQWIVLPAQPAASYLCQREPVFGTDWEHDAEIGHQRLQSAMDRLDRSGLPVLVEKSRIPEAHSTDRHYRSSLLRHVLDTWERQEEGTWFDLWRHPGAGRARP